MGMYSFFLFADHPDVVFDVAKLSPKVFSYFFMTQKDNNTSLTAQELGELINESKILSYLDEERCFMWTELGKVAEGAVQMHFYYENGRPFYFHFINKKTYLYIYDNDDTYMLNVYVSQNEKEQEEEEVIKIPCLQDTGENEDNLSHSEFDLERYKRDLHNGVIDFKKNIIFFSACKGEGGHPKCLLC